MDLIPMSFKVILLTEIISLIFQRIYINTKTVFREGYMYQDVRIR